MNHRPAKSVAAPGRRQANAAVTAAATKTKSPTIPAPSKASRAAMAASCAVSADTTAAMVVARFSESSFGNVFTEANVFTQVVGQLKDKVTVVRHGDLRGGEAILLTQTVGLNAIYTELVTLARQNLKDHFDAAERLMRLGLKAQGQCRSTLETLALICTMARVTSAVRITTRGTSRVDGAPVPEVMP